MSKEKELLERILNTGWLNHELSCEVEAIIAQPEQTEQEPVAWMYDLDMMIHPISNTRSQRFGELTVIDPTNRQQDAVNIRPLYTAPPKREPLSNEEIAILWGDKYSGKTFMVRNFARAIEKAHGIGGGGMSGFGSVDRFTDKKGGPQCTGLFEKPVDPYAQYHNDPTKREEPRKSYEEQKTDRRVRAFKIGDEK